MEEIYSTEAFVDFERTVQRYNPGDRSLHNQCCKNLKSYILLFNNASQFQAAYCIEYDGKKAIRDK
jgi:hypothetical protein